MRLRLKANWEREGRLVTALAATVATAAALAAAEGWARLTVVAGEDEVVVSLVTPDHDGPDEPATGGDGPVEHLHERDGEIRWTQTRWRRT